MRSQCWDERGGKDYDVKETNAYPEDFMLTLEDMFGVQAQPRSQQNRKGVRPTNLPRHASADADGPSRP